MKLFGVLCIEPHYGSLFFCFSVSGGMLLIISTFVILTNAVGGGEVFAFNPLQLNLNIMIDIHTDKSTSCQVN